VKDRKESQPYQAQARIAPEGPDLCAEMSFISGACKPYEITVSALGFVPFMSQPLPLQVPVGNVDVDILLTCKS